MLPTIDVLGLPIPTHSLFVALGVLAAAAIFVVEARRRAPMADLIRRNFTTPDLLFEAPPPRWGELIRRLPDGVIEAICHPAEPDDALPASTIGSAERVAELSALCHGGLRDRLAERGVQFATFQDAFGIDPQGGDPAGR